jgi:hypothetical protein
MKSDFAPRTVHGIVPAPISDAGERNVAGSKRQNA